jgi:pyruvate kinase
MKKVIVTIGPSLLYRVPLQEVHHPSYIYRINGAHGDPLEIREHILEIRKQIPDAEILVDLPGNKIRTQNLESPIPLLHNETFQLAVDQTNYPDFFQHLSPGTVVWANDSTYKFIVENATASHIRFVSKCEGTLLNNKGLHVRGIHGNIPFLLEKDRQLIEIANQHQVTWAGLSFVRDVCDIQTAQSLISPKITLISKVETKAAVDNLSNILELVDHILIDRGDLSTEIGIEKIPACQHYVVGKAHFHNKKTFLATQLLKNMEEKPIPTIAEIIDMYNSFKMGIYGIQLSEETAVGKYPRECLQTIQMMMNEVAQERS